MVPLCAPRVPPRLHRIRRAATAIDCIAPFSRLSASLHTGRDEVCRKRAAKDRVRITCPGDEALNDGDD